MTAQRNNQKNQWINQQANYESYNVHLKIEWIYFHLLSNLFLNISIIR